MKTHAARATQTQASAGPKGVDDAPQDMPAEPIDPVVDLDNYVPAYLTWIANKLSRGASQHYLTLFGTGIETWRCLVLLARHGAVSAQHVSRVIGMDKASVSRCFKSMQAQGLVAMGLDAQDGRLRIATLTPKGRELHTRMIGLALDRERALLSVLDDAEKAALIGLLRRLHDNLPAVEAATLRYVARNFPGTAPSRTNALATPPEGHTDDTDPE